MGIKLATPFTSAASVSFSWKGLRLFRCRTSLWPHQTGDVSDARSNIASAPGASQTSAERYCARSARSLNTRTKVPARAVACIISYQTAKETTCMQCPSYAEVTKKAIKAALKLCACIQHVIYASYLRTCLWNGFRNCPEAPQHCLPHLAHLIQLVRSLVETLRPEVGQKAAAAFKAIAGK